MNSVANNTMLKQAITDYLLWMISSGYSPATLQNYERILNHFLAFVSSREIAWNDIFTLDTMKDFQKGRQPAAAHAVRGLSRYLFQQKRIPQPIQKKEYRLPKIYEEYFAYFSRSQQVAHRRIKRIRRVLAALHDYLQRHKIDLSSLKIEQVDAFLAQFFARFAPATCKAYRSMIRGFLKYLYQERKIIKRNIAPLVIGAPMFARAKPPCFLRPHEVQKLFAGLNFSTPVNIRAYTMLHLAYTLGLRPDEICSITLDDISFRMGELRVEDRKTKKPIILPLPEEVIKAIAAYLIGVRPQSEHRMLFLSLNTPFGPITPTSVNHNIKICMRKVNPSSSAYWLRHTYAQNLLEAGVSIYEIKEMLGHDSIESTRKYLHIHIKLMREVLFDETI
jgi:integrase/recombinase XerD